MNYDSVEKIASVYAAAMDKEALREKPSVDKLKAALGRLKLPKVSRTDLSRGFGKLTGAAAGSGRGVRL